MQSDFKEKVSEVTNNIVITSNIISVILYMTSLIIWIFTGASSGLIKIIAIISLVIYIVLFCVLIMYSSSDKFTKNLSIYKLRIKRVNKLLKIFNIIIVIITTISLFTPASNSLVTILVNIGILIFNIVSIVFGYYLYKMKVRIFNKIKKQNEVPKSFWAYYFGTNNDKLIQKTNENLLTEDK